MSVDKFYDMEVDIRVLLQEFFESVIAKWHALKLLDGDTQSEEPLVQPYDVFNTQR